MTRLGTTLAVAAVVACLAAPAVASAAASTVRTSAPSAPSAAVAAAAEGSADWTLMIYDVADTQNIADDMIRNLAAFTAIPDMPHVNVVALVDLPEKDDPGYPRATLPGIAPFSTAKLLVLGQGKWNEVRDLGEISMGRPDALSSFIAESADRFPASKYGLVLSDHGGGYQGGYYDTGPPGGSHLSVADIRTGMLSGMQAAGIDRFELLDHDACLMSNYETASALAPLAKSMAGSEEVTAGDATLTLQAIQSLDEDVSGAEWAHINSENYAENIEALDGTFGSFTALSTVDGDQMSRLDAAVESFADVAAEHMSEIAPQVGRARAQALEFLVGADPSAGSENIVDLGDFLRHLTDVPDDVVVARDAVFTALQNVVIDQVTRQATQQATGLNVYFPTDPGRAGPYLQNHVAPPGWSRFVQAYADAGVQAAGDDSQAATFVSPEATVVSQGQDGILVSGQLVSGQSQNVTSSETQVYTPLGGQSDALAIVLPAYLNAGGEGAVQGPWSYEVTALAGTGQESGIPVSALYQAQSGGLVGTFYASYQSPGGVEGDVQFRVLLSSEGQIQSYTVSDASAGSGSAATVELAPGGRLTPYLVVPSSDSFTLAASTESVPVDDAFAVGFVRLPKGTAFDMGVVVGDVSGNYDGAFASGQVQ